MKRVGRIAAMMGGVLLLAVSAQAASVSSGSAGSARLCADAACTLAKLNLQNPSGPVTGTFSINIATLQLEFDLTLASAVLTGAADNGVTSLTLGNVRFQGTANIAIIPGIDTNGTALPNYWNVTTGTANVTGTATPQGGLPVTNISVSGVAVSGGCSQSGAGASVCGPIFNPFSISVNGQTRYLTTTLNVAAPEPAGLALLGLGLAVLAGVRGIRRS
jgi:hypothetical protein